MVSKAVVVRVSRHMKTPIYLKLVRRATVYRLLSNANPNTEFASWSLDGDPMFAPGSDYPGNQNHLTYAVSREFGPGEWRLPAGGPRFAAPILIPKDSGVTAYTVRFFNKILGSPANNKKKLVAALIFVVAVNAMTYVYLRGTDL